VRTHAKRLARLAATGFSQDELAKIHGPVGLGLGARAPAEIAIAVMAELVQLRRKRAARRIAGIVLAAGTSSRMGRNKLVEMVRGKPLVRHAVDAALSGGLDPVLVVSGHEAERIDKAVGGTSVTILHNRDFGHGLSSSLRTGLAAVPPDCDGAMILLGDMPGISGVLVDRLKQAFDPSAGRAICVAAAHGHQGHPVLWGRSFFSEIASLKGDKGARVLLDTHAAMVAQVETGDDAPLTDIDTLEALAAYQS